MDESAKHDPAPVYEMHGIAKRFGGVQALRSATLSLAAGEVHALVGENGAGKSTLIKAMAGIVRPDSGTVAMDGRAIAPGSVAEARRHGLSFIHQELNLVPWFSAAENIFLGKRYPTGLLGLVDRKELRRRAAASLAELGVELPLDLPVSRLSRGQQSMTAIARAFADEARVYVMDEPTAALSDSEIAALFAIIGRLRARGKTVLYVSHRLDEVFSLCDRVTIMRDGETVATLRVADSDPKSLIKLMIGRSLAEIFPPAEAAPGPELLRVDDLARGLSEPLSFSLAAGEILGIAGLVGSGRSSLLKALGGTERRRAGTMTLAGSPYDPRRPRDAIRAGVALVPEERRQAGLVLGRSVSENIVLPHLGALSALRVFIDGKRELEASGKASKAVRLKAASPRQMVGQLSGGNQQKVVFAKWLLGEVRLLLLDEPTRGVDVGARYEIYKIVREMAAKGAGVILASSDLAEVLGLSDRVMVLREGRIEVILDAKGLDQETVLRHCYGEGSN
ncbi:MAG: sugar ABC transporter ATP-binding protein [Spirochaetota bacterium]